MEKENRPYYKKLAILPWGAAPHPAREIISLEPLYFCRNISCFCGIGARVQYRQDRAAVARRARVENPA